MQGFLNTKRLGLYFLLHRWALSWFPPAREHSEVLSERQRLLLTDGLGDARSFPLSSNRQKKLSQGKLVCAERRRREEPGPEPRPGKALLE